LLLGRYLRVRPDSIEYFAGANGKPCLAGGQLAFNVTYSGDIALIALGQGGEIGSRKWRCRLMRPSLQHNFLRRGKLARFQGSAHPWCAGHS